MGQSNSHRKNEDGGRGDADRVRFVSNSVQFLIDWISGEEAQTRAADPDAHREAEEGIQGSGSANKLPAVVPTARCRLKLLKMERSKVDDLRGTPMAVGNLEEIIDDQHAIVSTNVGSEHYVNIMSFVDKVQLEPGSSVLLNHKTHAVIGVLADDTDPMVSVMKLEKAPQETYADSIVFIDENDAVGTKRYDSNSGGEREIQRTMLELLNQLDGFDSRGDVKVLMATNRIDSLDPALIRPGRIGREIEFPLPDERTKRRIFGIHTSRMQLSQEVDFDEPRTTCRAMCTEAGLLALRERPMRVTMEDFRKAKENILYAKKDNAPETLYL
ncbi:putative 26S protease regulatory subunit 4 [Aphelenchoides fujianensis]|nr:putative 26S protease regulatory subunit 4 [Aphelenchoides fujianensis]